MPGMEARLTPAYGGPRSWKDLAFAPQAWLESLVAAPSGARHDRGQVVLDTRAAGMEQVNHDRFSNGTPHSH